MKTSRMVKTMIVVAVVYAAIVGGLGLNAEMPAPSDGQHRADGIHRASSWPATISDPSPAGAGASEHARAQLDKLPLLFIENRGQEDAEVAHYVQGRDTAVYFTRTGVTFALTRPKSAGAVSDRASSRLPVQKVALETDRTSRERWAVRLDFVGADAVTPRGEDPTSAVVSYFKGEAGRSQTGLKTYRSIVYPELWPGIDLVYSGDGGQLKYTFMVKPGADPSVIRLAYRGATGVTLTDAGQLAIATPVGGFTDDRPYAYQEGAGGRDEIPAAYALAAASADGAQGYGFSVGRYDRSRPLVLDPSVLVYAGYVGGSGIDTATGIAVDAAGNAYVVGSTSSRTPSFPAQVGPDLAFGGGSHDAFVAKVKADGTGLVYLGYIGGAGNDQGTGIAVDSAGNAYVTGFTDSDQTTLPVMVGPDLIHSGGTDAFVAKIRADGTGLVYCGYIGGAGDEEGHGIDVDAAGNAYVTGYTTSDQTTFPVKVGPDLTHGGGFDAFVAKVKADGTALVYAGYLGGLGTDGAVGIAVDGAGQAHITGFTDSDETSFPVKVGPGLIHGGVFDAFVAKVKADGTTLLYAGYLGGDDTDEGLGIAVDAAGNAYVTGFTTSDESTFPVKVGPTLISNGLEDAFVAKLKADGTLLYAGYIGGAGVDEGESIAVDAAGNAYVAGITHSDQTTFPVTAGPSLNFNGGPSDAFVAKVKADGTGLLYAGYIGGAGLDQGFGIAVDAANNAYVAGRTGSDQSSFPVTVGPDVSFNGVSDAFVVKISGQPDLAEQFVTFFPTAVKPGGALKVFDTALNLGLGTAKSSTTRYYLSVDTVKSANDILLGVNHVVPNLAPGEQSTSGAVNTTVPASIPGGFYHVLACADDIKGLAELDETNNCTASSGLMQVAQPDLTETAVSLFPSTVKPGGTFMAKDTVKNVGLDTAKPSTTRYYLSADTVKSADDILLIGSRAVPSIPAGLTHPANPIVTVPVVTPLGSYHLLACADDTQVVSELNESNNCFAADIVLQVALPDLVATGVSNPPPTAKVGSQFPILESSVNIGALGAPASTTRYYLSKDGFKGPVDVLLAVSRAIPALAPSGQSGNVSSGSVLATIPTNLAAGTYRVLACADDLNVVKETIETNNCFPSLGAVQVTR